MRLTGVSCNNTAVPQQQYVCYKGISQIQNSITGAGIYTFEGKLKIVSSNEKLPAGLFLETLSSS